MPAKKKSSLRAVPSPAEATATGRPRVTPSVAIPAAIAGAARRRAAAKRRAAAAAKPARATRRKSADKPLDFARMAGRTLKSGPNKKDAKRVLDRGVGKADALLESAMNWVVKLAIRAKALYDMLEAWWHGRYEFPMGTLQAIVVGLLYFLSPFDLVPDVLPIFGLMDDAAIFAFVFSRIRQDLEAYAAATGKDPSDLGL